MRGATDVLTKINEAGKIINHTFLGGAYQVFVFHPNFKSLHGTTFLTQRYVLCLQHLAVVDVRPCYDQEVIRGAGFDVTKTQQLVILWTENMNNINNTIILNNNIIINNNNNKNTTERTFNTYTKQDFCIRLFIRDLTEQTDIVLTSFLSRHGCCSGCVFGY